MKLGTFLMPLHAPEKSRTECFDEDTEFVVKADRLGLTEAWCGQHLTLEWEPVPCNEVFLANLIARTEKIVLGAGVSILPQHHPVNVAARVALLDHLAHGRFYWGFGQGGVPTDWEIMGLPDPKTQGEMTSEAHDLILKIWTTDPPFKFEGRFWTVKIEEPSREHGIGYPLKPYQKPHPPIGVTLMSATSKGGSVGGRYGYIPMSANLVHWATVVEHWKNYCRAAVDAGRPEPDRNIWRIARSIYVGESDSAAWDFCMNSAFGRSFAYLLHLLRSAEMLKLVKHDPDFPDDDVTLEYMVKQLCIIGDKASVRDQLQALWERTGGFGTLLLIKQDFDDADRWLRSVEVLAREIVPSLPEVDAVEAR